MRKRTASNASNAASAALVVFTLLSTASFTSNAQVSGDTACVKVGQPDLRFKPQSAVGYFVSKKGDAQGQFFLAFFAEKIKPDEAWFWVASKALDSGDKFQGKTLEKDAKMEKRMAELQKGSVSVWGDIAGHSKHKLDALPAVHELADFTGVQITACSNMGYLNAGLDDEKVASQFKALRFPMAGDGMQSADVDFTYTHKTSDSSANLSVRGKVPFYVVGE